VGGQDGVHTAVGGVSTAAGGETGAGEGGGRGHTAGRGGCRGGGGGGGAGPTRGIRVALVAVTKAAAIGGGGRGGETQTATEWGERAGDRGEAMIEAGGERREWGHSSGRSVPRGGRIPED
jgi:hypothetical protein